VLHFVSGNLLIMGIVMFRIGFCGHGVGVS
jgi:hypothetical protein